MAFLQCRGDSVNYACINKHSIPIVQLVTGLGSRVLIAHVESLAAAHNLLNGPGELMSLVVVLRSSKALHIRHSEGTWHVCCEMTFT